MTRPLLPNSYVNFKDGMLPRGPVPSGICIFIGVGAGTAVGGAVTPVNTPNDIQTLFGAGPLARDLMTFFLSGGGFCYAVRLDSDTPGAIGTVAVGDFTGLTAGGTPSGAFDVRGRIVVAGTLGQAQVVFSLDGGRTWGNPQVLVSGANSIKGPGNFAPGITVTPTAMTYAKDPADLSAASTHEFSFTVSAPAISPATALATVTSLVQDPSLFFNTIHISRTESLAANLQPYITDLAAILNDAAANWDRYVYGIVQAAVPATPAAALALAQSVRANAASNRVQMVIQPMVTKSLGGQYVMNPSAVVAARRMTLSPQNDLGLVAAGQLAAIVSFAPGWSQANVIAMDQVQNNVTFRRFIGAAGFYPTNGWMTDPSSDYSADKFRLVADLVAADVRTAGLTFVKMDVDPAAPEASAKPLISACQVPLQQRIRSGQLASAEVSIPPGQDILTSKELVVEVTLMPIGSADWIKFNVGFTSPFTGA